MIRPALADRLGRMERQKLDSLRQEMAALDLQISQLARRKQADFENLSKTYDERGLNLPFDVADGMAQGLALRQGLIEQQMTELDAQKQALSETIMAQILEVKRWQIIADRSQQELAVAANLKEAQELEEAARLLKGRERDRSVKSLAE